MLPGLSSHVFFPHRLTTSLLATLHNAGAEVIEIVAGRHHFDYTDRPAVRELAAWFRDSGVLATLDQPRFADAEWSRHLDPTLNLLDPDKGRRIAAMDETKRALEAAEHIPFRSVTLYLGARGERWSPRHLEFALTAIEHLKAFATPLGVQLPLENIDNELSTPDRLVEVLHIGHFDSVGITLDLGHTNLDTVRAQSSTSSDRRLPPDPHTAPDENEPRGLGDRRSSTQPWPLVPATNTSTAAPGTPEYALDLLAPRIAQLHLHDNDRTRDAHLAPGAHLPKPGSETPHTGLDWTALAPRLAALPDHTPFVLELAHNPATTPDELLPRARAGFDFLQRLLDKHALHHEQQLRRGEPEPTR